MKILRKNVAEPGVFKSNFFREYSTFAGNATFNNKRISTHNSSYQ